MSNLLTALGIVISLLLSGYIIQAIMKLVGLIFKTFLVVSSFFRVKFKIREKQAIVSENFRQVYMDIKKVKISNKNLKKKASIDWFNLGMAISSLILIVVNLGVVSGRAISNLLYSLVAGWGIIPSAQDMNTLFTAVIFSLLSFSLSKVLQRWKETKKQRVEHKQNKIKRQALVYMTDSEMIDAIRKNDEKRKKELQ